MANHDNDRVLSRLGARELTPEEVTAVAAAGEPPVSTKQFTFGSDVSGDGHPE